MDISYITAPLIGSIIGYSTNWLAIKMMFRPRKEIRIGKIRMPFTPGIIPKNRENIAHAISSTISNNLLTGEDIKNVLISEETKKNIEQFINNKLIDIREYKINQILEENFDEEVLKKMRDFVLNEGSKAIFVNIKKENLGHIIAEQIKITVEEKYGGMILSLFGRKKNNRIIIRECRSKNK